MNNNIFKFITKEISHDSFICWILNWLEMPQTPENNDVINFSKNFLKQIIKDSKNKELENLLEKDFKIKIFKQFKKKFNNKDYIDVDVLVVIESKYIIIIEDKINTGIHDNQIERYKKGIMKLYNDGLLSEYNISNLEEKNIITCYYKMFEELKIATDEIKKEVDKVFNRSDMIKLFTNFKELEKYQYLNDYYQYILEMEKVLENYEEKKINITENGGTLTKKEIKQILYCNFISSLDDGSNYYGESPTKYDTTYWMNIPLNIMSNFGKDFFIKINLYYDSNRKNTLKIRTNTIYNLTERNLLIKDIENKIPQLQSIKKQRGKDANGEYTLLNYNIDNISFKDLKNIVKYLKFQLEKI